MKIMQGFFILQLILNLKKSSQKLAASKHNELYIFPKRK